MTNDGLKSMSFDVENELTNIAVAGHWQSGFVYDGLGRRRIERDYAWANGMWVQTNEVHYIYDGNLILQERDINNRVLVTYTRGRDFSGSIGGAGGIGGLLGRTDANGSAFYHADCLGNVTALINSSNILVGQYLYGPFGEVIAKWGPYQDLNEMQFSSMPRHGLSGFSMYLYRAYDPVLQRWLSRDPIAERGGVNLYGFVGNNPVNEVDPFGLVEYLGNGMTATFNSQGQPIIVSGGNVINYAEKAIYNAKSTGNLNYLNALPSDLGAFAPFFAPALISPDSSYANFLAMMMGGVAGGHLGGDEETPAPVSNQGNQLDLPITNARPGNKGPTSGVLCDSEGNQFALTSGRNGPAQKAPKGPGTGFDLYTSTHVEGHAAALMSQQGINQATLYINNPVICPNCVRNLPLMLPPGGSLTVVLPTGTTTTFVGK
jgi:RHS repeat-associated protein